MKAQRSKILKFYEDFVLLGGTGFDWRVHNSVHEMVDLVQDDGLWILMYGEVSE